MRFSYLSHIASVSAAICLSVSGWSQSERQDSIKASVITAMKRSMVGDRLVIPSEIRGQVTPLGDGSVVKFIQTLPGISAGAEGTSSFYARGGNLGNNLVTIDGVPIYGTGHLLGFSTSFSPDIVSETHFMVGGFSSEEGNFTASHIKLTSGDGNFNSPGCVVSASPFIVGATVSTPVIRKRLSFLGSFRASPLGPELKAIKGLTSAMDSISGIKASVYDAFGKLKWKVSQSQSISLSCFSSLDSYGYSYGLTSDERMSWSNLIASLGHDWPFREHWSLKSNVSFNQFANSQGMRKVLGNNINDMAMTSGLEEWTIQSMVAMHENLGWTLQGGLKVRSSTFSPGSSTEFPEGLFHRMSEAAPSEITRNTVLTVHAQIGKSKDGMYDLRASGRINRFHSSSDKYSFRNEQRTDLEGGALARFFLTQGIGVEATVDRTVQYYHTLEGIPLGWSLDMMIPSDSQIFPETATQYYAGAFVSGKRQSLSIGGYIKQMDNLLFFENAAELFNSEAASWRENLRRGSGSSKGLEILYQADFERLGAKVAYTLSKTDRLFAGLNEGKRFPAKFDRRHILNVTIEYIFSKSNTTEFGFNTFFTYQSGHWATVPAGSYSGFLIPDDEEVVIDYHSTINNWQMPAYIRWDVGTFLRYGKNTRHPGTLNLGIYNLLNRHNPYSITYDANDRKWKKLSIFPIMPTISWTMEL